MGKTKKTRSKAAAKRSRVTKKRVVASKSGSKRTKKQAAAKATRKKSGPKTKKESPEARKARAKRIVAELRRLYPDATCALKHESALQLLVATILSAQCTDDRVNMVTPGNT